VSFCVIIIIIIRRLQRGAVRRHDARRLGPVPAVVSVSKVSERLLVVHARLVHTRVTFDMFVALHFCSTSARRLPLFVSVAAIKAFAFATAARRRASIARSPLARKSSPNARTNDRGDIIFGSTKHDVALLATAARTVSATTRSARAAAFRASAAIAARSRSPTCRPRRCSSRDRPTAIAASPLALSPVRAHHVFFDSFRYTVLCSVQQACLCFCIWLAGEEIRPTIRDSSLFRIVSRNICSVCSVFAAICGAVCGTKYLEHKRDSAARA
jgi:hypothetical protein